MDTADLNLTLPEITPDYYQSSSKGNETTHGIYYSDFIEDLPVKVSITLYSFSFVLGSIGNGLVIWIAGFRMKRTVSAMWFLNLAIADFISCASLPLRIAEWVASDFFASEMFCILSIILFNLNMSTSVLLLTAMSIDRWVSVMWPFWAKVHRTRKLVIFTAAIIWVLSLILTCLVFYMYGFYFHDLSEWCVTYFYYLQCIHLCKFKKIIQLTTLVIMFLIPFLIIVISYVTIFFKLRKSKRPPRSQRPYRIITAVIVCFFICWFPYYIWPLTLTYDENNNKFYIVQIIIINLAFLNSSINPIIYVFMGQDFTLGFCRSIPSRVEGALSEHPKDLCRKREDVQYTCTLEV